MSKLYYYGRLAILPVCLISFAEYHRYQRQHRSDIHNQNIEQTSPLYLQSVNTRLGISHAASNAVQALNLFQFPQQLPDNHLIVESLRFNKEYQGFVTLKTIQNVWNETFGTSFDIIHDKRFENRWLRQQSTLEQNNNNNNNNNN